MAVREKIVAAATSSQSHVIVAVVLLSFVIWITLKGNLGKYLTFLGFGTPAPTPAAQQAATNPQAGPLGSTVTGIMGGPIGRLLGAMVPGPPTLPSLPSLPPIATPPYVPN